MLKNKQLLWLGGLALTLFFNKPHLIYGNSGYGGGSGTESDPYLISTPAHLNQLQLDVNVNGVNTTGKYYQLTKDIDLSGYDNDSDETNGNFTPIGKSYSVSFKGVFDGKGYAISNLNIVLPEQDYVGLFGYVNTGTIQDVGLENVVVEGKSSVGGLVGNQEGSSSQIIQSYVIGSVSGSSVVGGLVGNKENGTITQSYASGEVSGTEDVGGLVGYQSDGTIIESYATGSVSGGSEIGGLVGNQYNGTITQSYATGSVSGNEDVGGLVGNKENGTIDQSYATGNVSGSRNVGGLVGISDGEINQSYATGSVSGNEDVGGLVGYKPLGTINQSYATGNVSGSSNVGGLLGRELYGTISESYWDIQTTGVSSGTYGVGLTTAQMTGENAKTNMAGFDFNTVWKTTDNYPKLQWESEKVAVSNQGDITVNGSIQTMVADITIPSVTPNLVINPNLQEGFVAPEFSVSNDSVSPIKLELKAFEQTSNTFNDVLPTKYDSWEGLNKQQSQDIALGLVAKEGDGWQTLTTPTSYVANHTNHEIGIIKPTSSVDFSFDVKHGTAFSEAKAVQYKMIFMFDLMS